MYQNKIIGLITDIMPDSCGQCMATEGKCNLPMRKYPNHHEINKLYLNKRHKKCPLIILDKVTQENLYNNKVFKDKEVVDKKPCKSCSGKGDYCGHCDHD